ncbi:MAG: HD-GYP domain-containing protein [Candidatus Glassbacteria bacterium]
MAGKSVSIKFWVYLVALALLSGVTLKLLILQGEWVTINTQSLGGLIAFGLLNILSYVLSVELPTGGALLSVMTMLAWPLIMLFGPLPAVVVIVATWILINAFVRKTGSLRIAHNFLQLTVSAGLSGYVFIELGGRAGVLNFPYVLVPVTVGVLIFYFLNTGMVSLAVGFYEGMSPYRVWYENCKWQLFYQVGSIPLMLFLTYLYLRMWIWGLFLFFLPMMLVRQGYHLYLELKKTYKETVLALVKGIEASDRYTSGHSERVSLYARAIAEAMDMPIREIEKIEIAAILHDVGKIGSLYHEIIRKSSKLTPEEYRVIQKHPVQSEELVSHVSFLRGDIQKIIRHHHETYAGTGYPDGLEGDAIPQGSRIIAVADAYDAMTSDRPYRKALSHEQALEELERFSGYQFDPLIVDVVVKNNLSREKVIGEGRPQAPKEPPLRVEVG